MANKSVLSNQDVNSAGGSRHGFSLGQNFKFSMSTGMLLPAYSCFVNVGEQISGKPSFFIRADHLLNPVMGDVDVFVDCFFVPIRHLFAPFEQWLFQIDDNQTDMIDTTTVGYGPHFPVVNAGRHPFYFMSAIEYSMPNNFGYYYGFDVHRLLMHLGYNPQSIFANVVGSSTVVVPTNQACLRDYNSILYNTQCPNIPLYKLGAYQKIYYDYYRNTDFEHNNVLAYNFDSAYATGSVAVTTFANYNSKRGGIFELHYRDINKDYFTAVHPSPLFSSIGMLPNASSLLSRMNNWLSDGGPVGNDVGLTANGEVVHPVSAFGSLAYETDTDEGMWRQDGGTPPLNNVNVVGRNGDQRLGQNSGGSYYGLYHSHGIDLSDPYQSINTSVLRGMFAFDKLLRITQRAGKHVDDQTLAHFGFKQPAGVANETYVLKSYHSIFHFGEVTSTASTSQADLGQMAGRGVAMMADQKPFSFVAPCPGVFMAIISCAPRRSYIGIVEKDGYKCYLPDFFKPSVDNLGQQPMFAYETGLGHLTSTDYLRWQYRFMEDKIKADRSSLVFATNDKAGWTFSFKAPYIGASENVPSAYRSRFKVSPSDINKCFVYGYDGYPLYPTNTDDVDNFMNFPKAYLTDPFNVDFNMDFKRVSKMSIYGEPVLGGIC